MLRLGSVQLWGLVTTLCLASATGVRSQDNDGAPWFDLVCSANRLDGRPPFRRKVAIVLSRGSAYIQRKGFDDFGRRVEEAGQIRLSKAGVVSFSSTGKTYGDRVITWHASLEGSFAADDKEIELKGKQFGNRGTSRTCTARIERAQLLISHLQGKAISQAPSSGNVPPHRTADESSVGQGVSQVTKGASATQPQVAAAPDRAMAEQVSSPAKPQAPSDSRNNSVSNAKQGEGVTDSRKGAIETTTTAPEPSSKLLVLDQYRPMLDGESEDLIVLLNTTPSAPNLVKTIKGSIEFENETARICLADPVAHEASYELAVMFRAMNAKKNNLVSLRMPTSRFTEKSRRSSVRPHHPA